MVIYQSQNLTVASARNCRVCRAGADRAQGRVKQCRTGHGRGTDQKRQSKSRSERGQKQGRVFKLNCFLLGVKLDQS